MPFIGIVIPMPNRLQPDGRTVRQKDATQDSLARTCVPDEPFIFVDWQVIKQWIGLKKIYRKTPYFIGKSMVSCRYLLWTNPFNPLKHLFQKVILTGWLQLEFVAEAASGNQRHVADPALRENAKRHGLLGLFEWDPKRNSATRPKLICWFHMGINSANCNNFASYCWCHTATMFAMGKIW